MHLFRTCPSSSSYNDGSHDMLTMVPMMSLLYARSCAMLMTELFPDNGSLVIWWYIGDVICQSTEGVATTVNLPQQRGSSTMTIVATCVSVLVVPSIS